MAEAQYISDKAQGYDVLDIANKSASLVERAQLARLRREQNERERMQFEQQQREREFMRPALEAKREADIVTAYAAIDGFKKQQQYRQEYTQNNDALRQQFFEGTRGKTYDEQDKFLNEFIAKNSYLAMVPEAKGFLDGLTQYQLGVRNELAQQREFDRKFRLNEQEIGARKDIAKIGYEKATDTARIASESRERIAEENAQLKKAQQDTAEAYKEFNAAMEGIRVDEQVLAGKAKNQLISQDDYQKASQDVYTKRDAALKRLNDRLSGKKESDKKPEQSAKETPPTVDIGGKTYPVFVDANGTRAYKKEDGTYVTF